ncbi:MAG: hypothetical protein SNJ75_04070 [Gemmataceae bacterium]
MKHTRLLGGLLLLAFCLTLLTENAQGQPKKPDQATKLPADSEQLAPGEFVGILKSIPGSDRHFTLEIESARLVPSGGGGRLGGMANQQNAALRAQLQLQQAQVRLNNARTPQQRQQAMNQLRQAQLQLQRAMVQAQRSGGSGIPPGYKVEKTKLAIDFQLTEKAKIRTLVLPETFDEKGNLKTYSPKELAELKGKDKSAPGYEFSVEQLQVGQMVKVTLVRVPKATGGPANERDDADDKSKQVKLLVVMRAADPSMQPKGAKKK